jgi:hypothetical protein
MNRYKGNCQFCQTFVPAEAGFYDNGMLTCTEYISSNRGDHYDYYCLPTYNALHGTNFATSEEAQSLERQKREQAFTNGQEQVRQGLINGGLEALAATAKVRSLTQVINKITGADIAIADLDFKQATSVRNELDKRIHAKNNAKVIDQFKTTNTCNRCGGAGRADKWVHTGSTCYQCGGSGKYYN